ALPKIGISASNPDRIYAAFSSDGYHLDLYRSVGGGATWSPRASSPSLGGWSDYGSVLLVDPSNPDHVFAGGYWLSDSEDGGLSWAPLTEQWWWGTFHGIASSPGSPSSLWVTTDRGVYERPSGSWVDHNQGRVTLQTYDVCFSKNSRSLGYAGSQDWGTLVYHGNPAWQVGIDGSSTLCSCDPRDPLHVYSESPGGYHYVTHNGFATLSVINEGIYGRGRYL